MSIKVIDQPDAATVARLGAEITAFNFAMTGMHDGRELFAAIHGDQDELVAGVYGWTWGAACWIERHWVRESDRDRGVGTSLLGSVEREARVRGCAQVALATHSFQAPDFYRRHVYEVVGELTDYPTHHSYFLMRKRLI